MAAAISAGAAAAPQLLSPTAPPSSEATLGRIFLAIGVCCDMIALTLRYARLSHCIWFACAEDVPSLYTHIPSTHPDKARVRE